MGSLQHKLVRDVSALIFRSVFIRIIRIPVALITARVLGPAAYGLLQIINHIPSLTKYGSLGYDSVAFREIAHFRGSGEEHRETEVRDISFTADLLWSFFLTSIIIFVSFYYVKPEVKWGLRIAAVTLFISQLIRLYVVNLKLEKNFMLLAKAQAISQLLGAGFIIITIWKWGIFSVLVSGLISAVFVISLFHRKIGFLFRPKFQSTEWWRLTRIAIPMSLATLTYGMFGWVERGMVGGLYGLDSLGIYMLTIVGLNTMSLIVNSSLLAIAPHLYERLGRGAKSNEIGNILNKPTLMLSYFLPVVGAATIFLGPPIVRALLPAYESVIKLLPWLALILWIRALPSFYLTAMNSARLNQQVRLAWYWVVVVVIYAVLTWGLYHMEVGLMAPMVAKLISFILLTFLVFASTRNILWENHALFWRDIKEYFLPLCYSLVAIALVWHVGPNGWMGASMRMGFFIVLYLPLIIRWELRSGLLNKLGLLPQRWNFLAKRS